MLNISYCSDKYQYTMGKSFYDNGMKDKIAVFARSEGLEAHARAAEIRFEKEAGK